MIGSGSGPSGWGKGTMSGRAYGAQSTFGDRGLPVLDVEVAVGERYAVASEEPYAGDIAERIAAAEMWEYLPVVEFESWQIVGAGR